MLALIRYRTSAFTAHVASIIIFKLMAGGDCHMWSNDLGCCSPSDLFRLGSAFCGKFPSGFCRSHADKVACCY